ncbi:MAG TPA: hypothetical protein VNR68_09110, partial [Sphingomicrobium sp.]|nr:hypothetical protein [Sphingomicrobium sp.]
AASPATPAQSTPAANMPGMDMGQMDHSKMDHSKMGQSKMDDCSCCKKAADGKMECKEPKSGSASGAPGHTGH